MRIELVYGYKIHFVSFSSVKLSLNKKETQVNGYNYFYSALVFESW